MVIGKICLEHVLKFLNRGNVSWTPGPLGLRTLSNVLHTQMFITFDALSHSPMHWRLGAGFTGANPTTI